MMQDPIHREGFGRTWGRRTRWALPVLLYIGVAGGAIAQGGAGHFAVGPDQSTGGAEVAAAQRQQALSLATKLQAIMEHDSAVVHPTGYSIRIQRAYGRRSDWTKFDSGLPFYAGVFGTFFDVSVKPSPTHFGNPEFGIYANTVLQCPMDEFAPPGAHGTAWRVGELPVLEGGRRTGEIHGHAIYDGQCVIVSHSQEQPFRPLTREEYMQLQIGDLKANLDRMRKQFAGQAADANMQGAIASADKELQQRIADQEQRLAAMDAQTRHSPAAVRTGYQEADLVSPEEDDAVPLSVPNPAFFDRSLPPSQVQVISLFLPFAQSGARQAGLPAGLAPDWEPAMQKIRDNMDWAALESLLN